MPIYAYRCEACGFAKDVLQKVSDPQLTVCLSCGAPSFRKQVTAAGFQLKGTGWYATDFRNGASTAAPAVAGDGGEGAASKPAGGEQGGGDKSGADKSGTDKSGADKSGADKSAAPSTPAAPAAGAGSTPSSTS